MTYQIRQADYFFATVSDGTEQSYSLLAQLAELGINLLAFTAVPVGAMRTQFTIFPEDNAQMINAARQAGMVLDGPHSALLVQGDDELGAFAAVHNKLSEAGVNVYATSGITDGRGAFGYIVYVRPDDFRMAASILNL
ncbi:MAG: hypothetical protein ACO3NK_01220 [Prochlorotrichaceae cyanobacterium]|jgi:hypothetical protein